MVLSWKLLMAGLNPVVHDAVTELFTREYNDNHAIMVPALRKIGLTNMLEAGIRAQFGTDLSRALGSPIILSDWDKILLNPRQLFELPATSVSEISTKTVIGPNAKRPLELDIQIIITAMSNGGSLSEEMKVALAKGASLAGTATNTGESTVVESEREAAKKLIGQYNRGGWLNTAEKLSRLDAIEVQLGQGAWGGATEEIMPAAELNNYQKKIWNLKDGEDAVVHARMPGVNSTQDIVDLINRLKSEYEVPVGIKIAATHFIEKELGVIAQTNADFITIDGSEGGTSSAMPTLQDHVGLPTLFGLARAVNWLEKNNLRQKYNIVLAGGLRNPGHFLKALALGADAVYIGSIALIASCHTQLTKVLPSTVPPQLIMWNGKHRDELNVDKAGDHLANFLKSSITEMKHGALVTGKNSLSALSREDVVSVDESLSKVLQIAYAGNPCE